MYISSNHLQYQFFYQAKRPVDIKHTNQIRISITKDCNKLGTDSLSSVNVCTYWINTKEVRNPSICVLWVKHDVFGLITIFVKGRFAEKNNV